MENVDFLGEIRLIDNKKAKKVIETLVNAGFLVAKIRHGLVDTNYEIMIKKQ